jgi:uncharacterized protein
MNMTMTTVTRRDILWKVLVAAFALLLFAPTGAMAAEAKEEAALQKRFKARHAQLQQLKGDGAIGETSEGFIDFVEKKESKAAALVREENDDRKALYAIIAEKEGTTPEKVAVINAKRNFDRARPGEYLKQGGKWTKKEGAK